MATIQSDVAITGRVAQFGRGLMQDVADRLLTQFAQCVERSLTAEEDSLGGREAAAASAPQPVGMLGVLLGVFWKRLRRLFRGR